MCLCPVAFLCSDSEGQSAAIPVASMEFAAICLRNALLLLPEHQQQDIKTEIGSKSSSHSGSTESGSENSDACRSRAQRASQHMRHTLIINNRNKHRFTKLRFYSTVYIFSDTESSIFYLFSSSPVLS